MLDKATSRINAALLRVQPNAGVVLRFRFKMPFVQHMSQVWWNVIGYRRILTSKTAAGRFGSQVHCIFLLRGTSERNDHAEIREIVSHKISLFFTRQKQAVGPHRTGSISARRHTDTSLLSLDFPRRKVPARFQTPGYSRRIGMFYSLQHSFNGSFG